MHKDPRHALGEALFEKALRLAIEYKATEGDLERLADNQKAADAIRFIAADCEVSLTEEYLDMIEHEFVCYDEIADFTMSNWDTLQTTKGERNVA